ncbi:MAG: GT4 family glycosyltransferase PelF [Anaerolineae bacterium]|nr:GT4 family glycosyltransferase PelF [Anaerolineae bacterium]
MNAQTFEPVLPTVFEEEGDGALPGALTVCLVTEGTYPYYVGGVSTWCDLLIKGLPEVHFVLMSLVADPGARPVFELAPNVIKLIPVPLWGISEVLELERHLSFWQIIRRKRSAPISAIQSVFLPIFQRFLNALWSQTAPPEAFGQALLDMKSYFEHHDYDVTMRSFPVWECFLEESRQGYQRFWEPFGLERSATLLDATEAMRLLYRWLTVLTVEFPQVDVMHSAAAGLCSIPGILARQRYGTPFLLTEHGVYLRERLLALVRSKMSLFDQTFQALFAQRLTEASYFFADQIAPGSNYNQRWEIHNGAKPERIQTIYNGPDPAEFTPLDRHRPPDAPATIVWLGRIDPLKDLHTLIRAAAIVHQEMPSVRFVLYGKAPKGNEAYYEQCLALRDELGLRDVVIFAGFAASAEAAYNEGDFVILSSVSEGFPYSMVEAMMCGRTVVGTAVGGVPEALDGCGIIVEPRNPVEMAAACLRLLRNPELTRELGRKARERAIARFSLQQCNASYLATYQRLAMLARSRGIPRGEATPLWQSDIRERPTLESLRA